MVIGVCLLFLNLVFFLLKKIYFSFLPGVNMWTRDVAKVKEKVVIKCCATTCRGRTRRDAVLSFIDN